jgi:hypothetical protein
MASAFSVLSTLAISGATLRLPADHNIGHGSRLSVTSGVGPLFGKDEAVGAARGKEAKTRHRKNRLVTNPIA